MYIVAYICLRVIMTSFKVLLIQVTVEWMWTISNAEWCLQSTNIIWKWFWQQVYSAVPINGSGSRCTLQSSFMVLATGVLCSPHLFL